MRDVVVFDKDLCCRGWECNFFPSFNFFVREREWNRSRDRVVRKGVSLLVSGLIKAKGKMKSQPAENEFNAEI